MEKFDYYLYWNSRLSSNFGLEAVGYLGLGKGFNTWMYKVRKGVFLSTLRKLRLDKNISILDIGCGTGFYTEICMQMKYSQITGIDISVNAINQLRKKYPLLHFLHADISSESMRLPKSDLIICMDVLFHIVDDAGFSRAIKNISDSLEPRGKFIFSDNFLHADKKQTNHHVSRTIDEYKIILQAHGFKILQRKAMFFFLNYPIDSRNIFLTYLWKFFLHFVPGKNWKGFLLGAFFYPFERITVPFLKDGPSTEIMVCEKVR